MESAVSGEVIAVEKVGKTRIFAEERTDQYLVVVQVPQTVVLWLEKAVEVLEEIKTIQSAFLIWNAKEYSASSSMTNLII